MGELNEVVRKLKAMDWEQIYEKDNERLAMTSPPFEVLTQVKEYRFMWIIDKIEKRYHDVKRDDITILDVGTSSALMEYYLIEKGYVNVTGLDVDDKTLELCRDRVKECNFIKGLAEKIPVKDELYDVVICSQVIEHLLEPKVAVKEMLRVLKPKGVLIITVPIENQLFHSLHKHKFDLYKITKLFSEFGDDFKIVEIHKFDKKKVYKSPNVFAVVYNKNG